MVRSAAVLGLPSMQECVPDGGVFALVIPPVATVLLAFEIAWLLAIGVRELKRRWDLIRIRDLVIEGSLAQAILVSDRRSKDDVLAVCRAGIVAVQSSGDRTAASERIEQEARVRFGTTLGSKMRIALLLLIALIPVGLAVGGRWYAETVLSETVAALPEAERSQVVSSARAEAPFGCPISLGTSGAIALAVPALVIGWLEANLRSQRTRRRAVEQAEMFAEMAVRVIDPANRAYSAERGR